MKFFNTTPYSAKRMKNISPQPRRMMACVVARVLHDVTGNGELVPLEEPKWPIDATPGDTPLGPRSGDKPFYMGGVDILLGGRVYQPNRKVDGRLDIEIDVGRTFRRRIAIFGDRRWLRGKDGTLTASSPEVFGSMQLDFALAYGGYAKTKRGQAAPYGPNPRGRGYYLDELAAEGQLLPNLEDPNQLVSRWDDRPIPVGLGYYPEDGSLRPQASIDHPGLAGVLGQTGAKTNAAANVTSNVSLTVDNLTPMLFNQAHPNMVIPAEKSPKPGDVVRLSHGRKDGTDLLFVLPNRGFHLHVQLENRERIVPLHLDQIGIIGGEARVLLSYRVVFEYRLVRNERRVCSLYEGAMPEEIPSHYRRDLRDEWEDDLWGKELAS
ncbi:MAG: DUF2169 domain-containing protein [Polyangiaceae bacterium]|nr:DUF2169 domain-containing protein [Polyangiaceae bacterium]